MVFEQTFDNYKISVDWNNDSIWVTDTAFDVIYMDIFTHSVTYYRDLPSIAKQAFELVNMYQEALAISQTKNLSHSLLVELGYKEVK